MLVGVIAETLESKKAHLLSLLGKYKSVCLRAEKIAERFRDLLITVMYRDVYFSISKDPNSILLPLNQNQIGEKDFGSQYP